MPASIITGAAAGNGLEIARRLKQAGHYVVAIDRKDPADEVADATVLGDVLDGATMRTAFELALENCTTVYLVNNAGITRPEFPQSDIAWSDTLEVNLTAPFRWSREYASRVVDLQIKSGAIVFIGSLATATGFPKNASYQASKAGVLGVMRSFAFDLGEYGIRANCVSPGYIRTAMTALSYADASLNAARRKHTLLGRWGEPTDVANAVAFLCSAEAEYITGVNLPVDGGWLARGLIED